MNHFYFHSTNKLSCCSLRLCHNPTQLCFVHQQQTPPPPATTKLSVWPLSRGRMLPDKLDVAKASVMKRNILFLCQLIKICSLTDINFKLSKALLFLHWGWNESTTNLKMYRNKYCAAKVYHKIHPQDAKLMSVDCSLSLPPNTLKFNSQCIRR